MSDFLADLETELRAAARRRAAGRRPRVPVVLRRALPALAVLAVVVFAIARLAAPPDDDVGVAADHGRTTTAPLRAAVPVAACLTGGSEPRAIETPSVLREMLGVLRRGRSEPDGLPAPPGGRGASWLPLSAWAPDGVRRPGRDRLASELHLVPGIGATATGAPGCVPRSPALPSLCLVAGTAGDALTVACFTPEEVMDGAALALTGTAVHGVVADGVEAVTLDGGGRTVRAEVVENAYEAELPGARAGEPVTVRLEGERAARRARGAAGDPARGRRPDRGRRRRDHVLGRAAHRG